MALGDFKDGVRFVMDDEWFVLRTRDKLQDNVIHAIAYAPDGNLWLAGRGGVQYFRADQPASPWQHMPLPDNAQPYAFFVASDGLWIGHTNGARFLPYLEEEPVDLSIGDPDTVVDDTVTAITVAQNGLVYFGTHGLSIWDGRDFTYVDLLSDEERERNGYPPRVNALFADGDVVWVGASNGLYQFKQGRLIESWGETLLNLTGSTPSVGVVAPSPDGNGLLVAVGNNLYRFDMDRFELVLELDSEIRSIYAMPYALMLATGKSGIYSLPKDDFGIYWDQVSGGGGFARCFGYQAITMSDGHTLWTGSWEGGLQRSQALYGQ
jgi:ligand-binding sensor domain-containing protein